MNIFMCLVNQPFLGGRGPRTSATLPSKSGESGL
jgi:hypothetical protein